MQDVQNIPNPDVSTVNTEDDFGSHSDYPEIDAERDNTNTDIENIPVPPDRQDESTPIEEPPTSTDEEGIDDDSGGNPKFV